MWPFGSSDTRKAKQLESLADRTIALMQELLSKMPTNDPNRNIVEAHLERRRNEQDRYSMLARGESDDMELLMPILSDFDIWKGRMEAELQFGSSVTSFVSYLKEIKRP
jgi:hypothetical protein